MDDEALKKKINSYTSNFLQNICSEIANKEDEKDLYLKTEEALRNNQTKDRKKLNEKGNSKKNVINNNKLEENQQNDNDSARDAHPFITNNVIKIQRAFKKFFIKTRSLPENFFFTQQILKCQFEKRNKNFEENYNILFRKLDSATAEIVDFNNSIETIKTTRKQINSITNESKIMTTVIHNPYEDGKIHLFGKIMDIDIINDTSDIYEETWANSFKKVYNNCLKNKSPFQLLEIGSTHTAVLNSKGKVYTFGWNNHSQCGIPINSSLIEAKDVPNGIFHEFDEYNNISVMNLNSVKGVKTPQIEEIITIKDVACGEDHTLLLDTEGNVWSFGLNLNGQLGLGHNKLVNKPEKIQKFSQSKIKRIISEGDISFAIGENGETYMWPVKSPTGTISSTPKIIQMLEKISTISCGGGFALFLNSNGMVYSMGRNNTFGQLGHGDNQPRLKPTLIETFHLNNDRVSQISCGMKHCLAKTFTNKAYSWGLGSNGQLGHGNFKNYSIPYQVVIENTPYLKIFQISCGFRNSFFLTENRKIYYTGYVEAIMEQNYPSLFNSIERLPELRNESEFSVVRILNSWNKSFSIFYVTIADSTMLKNVKITTLNQILNNLASKWDFKSIYPPYLEAISGYFNPSIMKKNNDCNMNKK